MTHPLPSALLDTGCCQGELRSLQFSQVRWTENVFLLTADKTKTRKARAVLITARLRAVLQRRQTGPDGQTLGPGCYVFGTEVGERRGDVQGAWRRACDAAGRPARLGPVASAVAPRGRGAGSSRVGVHEIG